MKSIAAADVSIVSMHFFVKRARVFDSLLVDLAEARGSTVVHF